MTSHAAASYLQLAFPILFLTRLAKRTQTRFFKGCKTDTNQKVVTTAQDSLRVTVNDDRSCIEHLWIYKKIDSL